MDFTVSNSESVDAGGIPNRIKEFGGVVGFAGVKNELHPANIGDSDCGISLQHHQIGLLSGLDSAEVIELAEEFGAVGGGDLDGFDGGESALDEKFDIT